MNTAPFYGEAHVEYHLNGFLTNKLPLFNKLHWHLVAGTNLFYLDNDVRYYEQFIGIENIGYKLLRLGRIDFIQSIRKNEPSLFGVRFSLTNLSQNGLTDNHLGREW